MALNINGTTGISGVDGSASAPAVTGTDSNTGINFASDTVNINTGGVTRATVDSSGRLLVGTTTEGADTGDDLTISNSGNMGLTLRSTDSNYCNIYFSDATSGTAEYSGYVSYQHSTDSLQFATASIERVRITSDGRLLINTSLVLFDAQQFIKFDGTNFNGLVLQTTRAATGTNFAIFANSSGTQAGKIQHSGSTTVSYTTSSDYRLKENASAISDGITRLKTLKPYRFNFIEEPDKTVDGFFAHEAQTAVPEAITGTKDEVDSDNNPVYQGIDQSKLVPLLTAALQEAIAKIETLETKVAALEAG